MGKQCMSALVHKCTESIAVGPQPGTGRKANRKWRMEKKAWKVVRFVFEN